MAKRQYHWVLDKPLTPEEKATVTAACERLIDEEFRPRYLIEREPEEKGSHPIAIFGKWRGHRYSFIARYRSDWPDTRGEEFDTPFARLDHRTDIADGPRFDVMWLRHTGTWWPIRRALPLEEALAEIAQNRTLHPL